MILKQWGFVALENGLIQAGIISEYSLGNEPYIRVELPRLNGLPPFFEYHKVNEVKGIRVSTQEECEQYFPKICEDNQKLKEKAEAA